MRHLTRRTQLSVSIPFPWLSSSPRLPHPPLLVYGPMPTAPRSSPYEPDVTSHAHRSSYPLPAPARWGSHPPPMSALQISPPPPVLTTAPPAPKLAPWHARRQSSPRLCYPPVARAHLCFACSSPLHGHTRQGRRRSSHAWPPVPSCATALRPAHASGPARRSHLSCTREDSSQMGQLCPPKKKGRES